MKKRKMPPSTRNEKVKRQRDPLPWRYCLLTLVCGLFLVGGFFYAARQHFSAMEFGIKNAKLRQQKEDLESEQRRLFLTREVSLSPAEIKKAAKKIGLQEFTASSIQYVSRKIEAINPLAEKASDTQTKQAVSSKNPEVKPTVKSQVKPVIKEEKTKTEKKEVKNEKSRAQTAMSGDIRQRIAK